jgi:hypothetical protein
MMLARTTAALALRPVLLGVLLLATGCSGSDEAQPGTVVPAPASPSIVESTVPNTEPATSEPATSEPVTSEPPLVTVPDEPVPGLDSDDPFCRAWSQFAGSFQALALASGVGADPSNAVRLEVAASGAVMGAVVDLGASMPADLDDEREAFLGGLLGPFANRASLASETMSAAGLTSEQVDELGDLWLAAIARSGDPDLVLMVPSGYQPAFDDAVASFSADVVPVSDDPSLVTDAAAPQTLSYIAATCPDQGILAGNDNIDD